MDALKKMDKKYLFIIGAIFGSIILLIIIVALVRSCSGPSNDYSSTEDEMISAANKYFTSDDRKLPEEFESKEVSAQDLASSGKMDDLDEYLEDTSCTGKVVVYNHGGQMLYVPHLDCSEYKTKHLSDVIIEDNLIDVPEDQYQSGLYKEDNNYVFKGKEPNNFVSFGGLLWRILDIDENGLIRMIRTTAEQDTIIWDNKYNKEANGRVGENDYKYSYLYEKINDDYMAYKDENKLHMAAHDACIAPRDANVLDIDRSLDCSQVMENQYVTLISISDHARPSLDANCTSVREGACYNYNYMVNVTNSTWTLTTLKDNTYKVCYINGVKARCNYTANTEMPYSIVIAVEGYEEYVSGDGTLNNPYVVGTVSEK